MTRLCTGRAVPRRRLDSAPRAARTISATIRSMRALEPLAESIARGATGRPRRATCTSSSRWPRRRPQRAEHLFRLGEAILLHLGDVERADDVFLRASDIDPSHVPTLRRLLDVYWRADNPGALVDVASELVKSGAIAMTAVAPSSLAQGRGHRPRWRRRHAARGQAAVRVARRRRRRRSRRRSQRAGESQRALRAGVGVDGDRQARRAA